MIIAGILSWIVVRFTLATLCTPLEQCLAPSKHSVCEVCHERAHCLIDFGEGWGLRWWQTYIIPAWREEFSLCRHLSFTLLGSHAQTLSPLPWLRSMVTVVDRSTIITRIWDQQFSKEVRDIYRSPMHLLDGCSLLVCYGLGIVLSLGVTSVTEREEFSVLKELISH